MELNQIKLPMNLTAEDIMRKEFNEMLIRCGFNQSCDRDGKFENQRIENMWQTCKLGAISMFTLMEDRIRDHVDRTNELKARIKELEGIVNSSK